VSINRALRKQQRDHANRGGKRAVQFIRIIRQGVLTTLDVRAERGPAATLVLRPVGFEFRRAA
jgi:hypothetical protein